MKNSLPSPIAGKLVVNTGYQPRPRRAPDASTPATQATTPAARKAMGRQSETNQQTGGGVKKQSTDV